MASPIVRGQNFGSTEIVNATKLQNIVDNSTFKGTDGNGVSFSASSGGDLGACVAAGGLEVHSTGQLQIKDSGITTAKIANSSSKTTGVTFAKMQHISTAKILGRISASEGDVEEAFDFKDEDDMSSNSATALASQQSIKAYVDANSVFTKSFVSSDQTLPNDNSEVSVAHSLGEVPKIIQVFAKMTASVNGYASGDFVLINTGDAPGTGNGVSLCTASNVAFYRSGSIRIASRSGIATPLTLSSSNCSLVLKAFA